VGFPPLSLLQHLSSLWIVPYHSTRPEIECEQLFMRTAQYLLCAQIKYSKRAGIPLQCISLWTEKTGYHSNTIVTCNLFKNKTQTGPSSGCNIISYKANPFNSERKSYKKKEEESHTKDLLMARLVSSSASLYISLKNLFNAASPSSFSSFS
jgi:hypothetical protein